METKTEKQWLNNGPLISVPHKDTVRLLEVYVKRSLSLNDGNLVEKRAKGKEKWVTKKQRRHSSDPSLHLDDGVNNEEFSTVLEPPTVQPETHPSDSEKPTKKSKKNKKPSFWKNLFSIFTRKSNEDKDEDQDSPPEMPETFEEDEVSDAATTCLPTPAVTLQKKSLTRKSIKRRFSKRHLSLRKSSKLSKDLNTADITGVQGKFGDKWTSFVWCGGDK